MNGLRKLTRILKCSSAAVILLHRMESFTPARKIESLIGSNLVAFMVVFIIFSTVTVVSLPWGGGEVDRRFRALTWRLEKGLTAAETHVHKKHMYHIWKPACFMGTWEDVTETIPHLHTPHTTAADTCSHLYFKSLHAQTPEVSLSFTS